MFCNLSFKDFLLIISISTEEVSKLEFDLFSTSLKLFELVFLLSSISKMNAPRHIEHVAFII